MHRYIVGRLITAVPVVIGVLVLTFLMLQLTAGDLARVIAGPDAPASTVEAIREQLGLDQPAHVQFLVYVKQLLRGELGQSIISKRLVEDELKRLFPHTFELLVLAMTLAAGIGIPAGIVAAARQGSYVDHA